MRNLVLFILFLIAIYYVRRALRRPGSGSAAGGPRADDDAAADAGRAAPRQPPRVEAEQMVACAHCGLHVPESEGLRSGSAFFCCEDHRRLGVRR